MRARILFPLVALLVAAVPAAAATNGRGERLYGRYCLACHGAGGGGVAPPGQTIGAGPERQQEQQDAYGPTLAGVGAQAADFYLRSGYMPLRHLGLQPRRSRVLFSESQIRALVGYIASLAPGPPIPRPHPERGNVSQGLKLFTDHCAGCHQVVAEGGYVPGAVAPPLEEATATQIAEAVRIGPWVMPKFSKRAIPDRQLDSIIAYVEYAKNPDDRGGWALGHLGPVPEGMVTWLIAAVVLVATCIVIGERLKRE